MLWLQFSSTWWEHAVSLTQGSAGMLNPHYVASPSETWWMHAITTDLGGTQCQIKTCTLLLPKRFIRGSYPFHALCPLFPDYWQLNFLATKVIIAIIHL